MSKVNETKVAKVYGTTEVAMRDDGPAPKPCKLESLSCIGGFCVRMI